MERIAPAGVPLIFCRVEGVGGSQSLIKLEHAAISFPGYLGFVFRDADARVARQTMALFLLAVT